MILDKAIKYIILIIICANSGIIYSINPMPIKEWNSLLQSNEKFAKSPNFFKQHIKLKNEQNPPVIVLSCSDSRVTPEFVFNKKPGELFVVRVAGQVIDDVVINSIEYAVNTFGSHVIVILGHSNCGAVDGALKHLRKNGGVKYKSRDHLGAVLIPIETAIMKAGVNINDAKAFEKSIQANIKYEASQLILQSNTISNAINNKQLIIIGAEFF